MTVYEILNKIQVELKAPKSQFNAFGKYHYRSCEDILEAVKPLLSGAVLTIADEIVLIGNRYYVKATATLSNDGQSITNSAYAREEEIRKGMDSSQITGATSSYARKYCLNGLLLIDDTKDADSTNKHDKVEPEAIKHEIKPKEADVPIHEPTKLVEVIKEQVPGSKVESEFITVPQQKRLFALAALSKIEPLQVKAYLMKYYNTEHSAQIKKVDYKEISSNIESKEKFDHMMSVKDEPFDVVVPEVN